MNNKFRILSCFLVATLSLLLTSCVDIKKKENLDPYANEQKIVVEPRVFDVFNYQKSKYKGLSVYVKSVSDFTEPLVDPKYAEIKTKTRIGNIRYVYDYNKPDPIQFNNSKVLGRLDNYTIEVPSSVSFKELYANYVKKAFDKAGFNVVSSLSKYSLIVEVFPGNLIAMYFDNDKSQIKVRNEFYISISQEEEYYLFNAICDYGGSNVQSRNGRSWLTIEEGNIDNKWFTFDTPYINESMTSSEKYELLSSYVNEILQVTLSLNQSKLVKDLRVLNKSLADKSGKMIDVSKTLRKFEQAHDSSNEARCYVKHSGGYITDPVELEAIRKSFEYDRKYVKRFDVVNNTGKTVKKCSYDSYREELKCEDQ